MMLPGLRVRKTGVCMQDNGILAESARGVGLGIRRRSLHPRPPASGEQQAGLEWLETNTSSRQWRLFRVLCPFSDILLSVFITFIDGPGDTYGYIGNSGGFLMFIESK